MNPTSRIILRIFQQGEQRWDSSNSADGMVRHIFEAISLIRIYMNSVMQSESNAYSHGFHDNQSIMSHIRDAKRNVEKILCTLYVMLTSSGFSIPNAAPDLFLNVMASPRGRAEAFKRDYILLMISHTKLEYAVGLLERFKSVIP